MTLTLDRELTAELQQTESAQAVTCTDETVDFLAALRDWTK